jgi:ubiquinone/menaquinone biosynthesis C-methylase UbiE
VDDPFSRDRVQAAYDAVANNYEAAFGNDLAQLPVDRLMLDRARRAAFEGVVLDLGCGTGSAGSYLIAQGVRVVGIDLSVGMLKAGIAADRPQTCQGDMRNLPFSDGVFASVVAFYSIQHVPRAELSSVFTEVARVLEPDGVFLLAIHLGEGEVYSEEFLGHRIANTGGCLYSTSEIFEKLTSTGFALETSETRGPLEHEHQTQRLYLLARRGS